MVLSPTHEDMVGGAVLLLRASGLATVAVMMPKPHVELPVKLRRGTGTTVLPKQTGDVP